VNNAALIREAWRVMSGRIMTGPGGYLDDGLFGDGAGPPLAGVEPLVHGEAAAVGLEPLHQQVVDGGKVVVAFVLERLEHGGQRVNGGGGDYQKKKPHLPLWRT